MPTLSIITINLNNSEGLRRTIKSVVSQKFNDFEYLIVDGGSSDESLDVIRENEKEIDFWISEPDYGIYNAMNKGINKAKGEYVQFLNSGDWYVDETILSKVFGQERVADIVYGDIYEIGQDGFQNLQSSLPENLLTLSNFNSDTRATIQHPAAFIKRSQFARGLYDESYKIIADIKFFIERIIFQNCSVEYLPYAITNFNMDGLSSKSENWVRTIEERKRIFSELLPPRIMKDYEFLFLIKESPILKYIPFLETTTGLKKLITGLVGLLVNTYKFFRG